MFAGASLDENSGAFCELKANFFRLILTKAELLALTYNDINLEEKTISINKSYQRLKGKTFSVYQIAYGTLYGYRNCAVWCKADTTS